MNELMKREAWLEQRMIGLGVDRYLGMVHAGREEDTRAGKLMVKQLIPASAEAIAEWITDATSGRAGRDVGAAQFVAQFKPEDLAYITLRILIAKAGDRDGMGLTGMSLIVANHLAAAMDTAEFRKDDEKAWLKLQKKIEKVRLPGRKYVIWRNGLGKAGVKTVAWDHNVKVRVGSALISRVCEATGAFEIVTVYEPKRERRVTRVAIAESTRAWLEEAHQRNSLLDPMYLPMVVPPRKWTTPFNGGYYDRSLRLRLVSSTRVRPEYFDELKNAKMPAVYAAINAVQGTPWRINKDVLAALRAVWESGLRIGGLPPADDLPVPPKPWGDGEPESDEQKQDHYVKVARIRETNDTFFSKRLSLQRKLWLAGEFENDEAIYFPHTLDFRGRMYPVVDSMHPQSDDTGRALLEFANGVPLGEEGGFWMAVHGANTYGVDKVPFQERAEWVVENQAAILACAQDPLANRWWTDADKPFTFLAFCFEWAKLVRWVADGNEQDTFVSRMPVGMDGSCNGLQNFSAMLRDPVGGAATNLIPSDRPSDIYQQVADVASKIIEQDAANGEVNACIWRGKLTRKFAKRPTMTLPYGSGQYGFGSQIEEELTKYKITTGTQYLHGDHGMLSRYLAKVMYQALGSVVVKSLEAMHWLKKVSAAVAKEGLPVWWTAPSGFPVCQIYRKVIGKEVDFTILDKRYRLMLAIDTDEVDSRKQAQAVAPNFVHSLDAAHLVATVRKCLDAGINDFAMVHDSYGTHAGNIPVLNRCLREAFVEQYSQPVLENFVSSILSRAEQAKLPPPPQAGTLDLTGVLDSEYFFA